MHALCSTQQALLRTIQDNIITIIACMNINLVLMLIVEAGRRIYPERQRLLRDSITKGSNLNIILASVLKKFMNADARIADISFKEERRMLLNPTDRNNQFFAQLTDSKLRDITSFPRQALCDIKNFLKLPRHIYIKYTTGEIVGEEEDHAGCRFFYDEEMILFSMAKLAKGLTTTVLVDLYFGGDRRRWSLGFRFFLKRVRELVYPNIVGFKGIRRFVGQFPGFAANFERKMEKERTIRGRDGVIRNVDGRRFVNGNFNLVGTFDCRIQKTNIPGTHPDQHGHRRLDAYEIQEAVYSGHKKTHGVKAFTCMLVNGLSFMHHPVSARR